jgi:hypothetical protein
MTTHTVKPAVKQAVLANPAYAVKAAAEIITDAQPAPANTAMSDALTSAFPTTNERSIMFHSQAVKKQLQFFARKFPGMMATRISRLEANKFQPTPEADTHAHFAEYGMYPDGSRLQCRHELITMAQELAWILEVSDSDNGADIITHAINEWCGGGFAGKPKEEAIAGWVALGLTREEAMGRLKDAQMNTRNYLTVKRERLFDAMISQIDSILERVEPTAVSDDVLKDQIQRAYDSAAMFNNTTEMIIIRADMIDNLGCEPTLPVLNKDLEAKANRIREQLANAQDERAQQEARRLATFDPLADENDADMAA